MDCGPSCLKMIADYYDKIFDLQLMNNVPKIIQEGTSFSDLCEASENIGLKCLGLRVSFSLLYEIDLPLILQWNQNHFVVLFKIQKKWLYIADPAKGILRLSKSEFLNHWQNTAISPFDQSIVLQIRPY